ncbi:putative aarF domain-containing protein kinase 2 [Lamellibrachia satsuma]|nr:putative aarF domain-containing protein kinase 2 [Lamellibrachia satsuma]
MDASLVTTWGPKRYQVLLNQFSTTVKAAQSCLISSQKRSTVFLLELAPLSVFSHRKKCRRNLSPLVLAAIPNEVFTKEAMFTTQQPQNIFLRLLTMIWDVVVFTVRFVHVVIAFLPVLCLLPMTYISTSCVIMWRQLLLLTVVHMGPTFIKLGQWASTRRDLFSPEFCNLFSKLHTRATEHTWAVTKSNLEKAFGERWSKVLLMMDENPIGSGCIAQVHKAYMRADTIPDRSLLRDWLKDNDMETITPSQDIVSQAGVSQSGYQNLLPVAVKVLHPDIYMSVTRDLVILRVIARTLEQIFPRLTWLSLTECVSEFADLMTRQIDLRHEAVCLEQFGENFLSIPNIRFPKPIHPYCKRDVLVETFEAGEPLSSILTTEAMLLPVGLKEILGTFAVDALLQMIFLDNFVHGDLHPGNILVQNCQSYKHQEEHEVVMVDMFDLVTVDTKPVRTSLRLVLLDVGITACLGEKDRQNFKAVFKAVVRGQGEVIAELMLKHSRCNNCEDVEGFTREVAQIVKQARQLTVRLGKIQVGELLSDVFGVLSKHKVMVESNFASMLLAIFVVEGLGRSLNPDLDILERARPFLLS